VIIKTTEASMFLAHFQKKEREGGKNEWTLIGLRSSTSHSSAWEKETLEQKQNGLY